MQCVHMRPLPRPRFLVSCLSERGSGETDYEAWTTGKETYYCFFRRIFEGPQNLQLSLSLVSARQF